MFPERSSAGGESSTEVGFRCEESLGNAGIRRNLLSVLAAVLVVGGVPARAVSCLTQGTIPGPERELIRAAATPVAEAVGSQQLDGLQGMLLPAVLGDWDGIRATAQAAKALVAGGTFAWRTSYLLDATDLKAAGDAQFFCTNTDSSVTVTVNLRGLPPGKYALVLGDYTGAALAGQLGLLMGQDATENNRWKLGGIYTREGALGGHDGVWYWVRARNAAHGLCGDAQPGQAECRRAATETADRGDAAEPGRQRAVYGNQLASARGKAGPESA
jgi:hypothetical protein